ncbi:FliI/YscN family ATPase [Phycisphaerales bacterium AB-hyl4]|uniref:FliI/YscN family ATPase n=1 Tax=Natronomicrosphaera hydrolytica TaxID=3242702 RepID=A0ABV4U4X2_9BACT
MSLLAEQFEVLEQTTAPELRGTVSEVRGLALRVAGLPVPIGAMVRIDPRSARMNEASEKSDGLPGEVVGFDREYAIVMPLGAVAGVRPGDDVVAVQHAQQVRVGESLLGRVLDGFGRPIDGGGPLLDTAPRPLHPSPVDPMDRPVIEQPLATGVRAVDAMISLGRGQRLGVFAAPGVGKSTLLGGIAKHTAADVSVIALVGERGREVRDFIDNVLGPEGLKRSVVVCATSDEPALLRLRAAMVATSVAEYFRDQGKDVLLVMDSVTRFCQAQRQIGLAAGEPPATRGYPPSVFSMLPTLLERSGSTNAGSITGLYAVLVEGDDMDEPIADACRGVLDGHVLLSRQLAEQGHYPAIDVLGSISRVANDVTSKEHQAARREVLKLVSSYRQVEELLNIGAYAQGSNADFDLAIACKPAIDQLLQQGGSEVRGRADFQTTQAQLFALTQQIQQQRKQLNQAPQQRRPVQGPRG